MRAVGIPWNGEGTSACGSVSCSPSRLCALTSPSAGEIPAGKIPELSISHPEHPSDNKRDNSRLSLSRGLGKSLQIRWDGGGKVPGPRQLRRGRTPGAGRGAGPGGSAIPGLFQAGPGGTSRAPGCGTASPGWLINPQLEQGRGERQL